MKKFLVWCLTLLLVVAFSFTTLAAPNGFINSPTAQPGPELIEGDVVIIPHSNKDTLDDDKEDVMDDAYESITNAENLGELNDELKNIAADLGIDVSDLAVSDLFYVDFDEENADGIYEIAIKPETLKNYAGLMYFDGEKWVMIDDANIKNGKLYFQMSNPGPVAIVANAGSSSANAPQTGDTFPWVYVGLIAVSAAGLVVVLFRLKKKEA